MAQPPNCCWDTEPGSGAGVAGAWGRPQHPGAPGAGGALSSFVLNPLQGHTQRTCQPADSAPSLISVLSEGEIRAVLEAQQCGCCGNRWGGLGWALLSAGGAQCCASWCDTPGGMGFFCTFLSTTWSWRGERGGRGGLVTPVLCWWLWAQLVVL